MVVWSILTLPAWHELQRRGRLRASRRHVMQDFVGAYLWMAGQMQRRLKHPQPSADTMPIWAWYRWKGNGGRPDLRSGGHLPKGQQGVRVELHVADDRVLLSDFDLWHYVLNYWYLAANKAAGEAFERKLTQAGLSIYRCDHPHPLPHAEYRQAVERSWERIFDVARTDRRLAAATSPKQKPIQATLWELLPTDVVNATEFTAK